MYFVHKLARRLSLTFSAYIVTAKHSLAYNYKLTHYIPSVTIVATSYKNYTNHFEPIVYSYFTYDKL